MSIASFRRFIPAVLIACALALPAIAQGATDSNSGVVEAEKRLAEEIDRLDKKKAACAVEFANLLRPAVHVELATDASSAVQKHKDAIRTQVAEVKAMNGGAGGRRPRTTSEAALADDIRTAFETRVGRNLASAPVCEIFVEHILAGINGGAVFKTEDCVKNAIAEVFSGVDFEKNWTSALLEVFGKKVKEATVALDAAKRLAADAAEAAKVTAAGGIPGMILVPEGEYVIGLDLPEIEKLKTIIGYPKKDTFAQSAYGFPAHKRKLNGFFMDQNEVTNRWYEAFCRETGHKPPKHWISPEAARQEKPAGVDPGTGPGIPVPVGSNNMARGDDRVPPIGLESAPVAFITLEDAKAFVLWCGRRLPTEFEWEAGARYRKAGETMLRLFPWGDDYSLSKARCNSVIATSSALRQRFKTVTPVGLWPDSRSALGFNDLSGNVIEITISPFVPYPGFKPEKAPKGTNAAPYDQDSIVCRGGSATTSDFYSATSIRYGLNSAETSFETVGFRTVASQNRTLDYVAMIMASSRTGVSLAEAGRTLKDEVNAKAPTLNAGDPDRAASLIAGGWNLARNLPAKAKWIGAISRATKEFNSDQRVRDLAREHKEPVLLGHFSTDVDLKGVPAGSYSVMWNSADTKLRGKENNPWPDGIILRKAGESAVVQPMTARMVLVPKSTEKSKVKVVEGGKRLSVVFTYLVKDMKDARMTLELTFEAEPENLKDFR